MSYEVTKGLRTSSIIRAEGAGTYTITLADMSANTDLEVVSAASIKRMNWSTNGSITIARNATTLLTLYGNGEMRLDDFGTSLSNTSTANVVVTIASGGSIVMDVSKVATYTTDLGLR
jgi:hypothetical protein